MSHSAAPTQVPHCDHLSPQKSSAPKRSYRLSLHALFHRTHRRSSPSVQIDVEDYSDPRADGVTTVTTDQTSANQASEETPPPPLVVPSPPSPRQQPQPPQPTKFSKSKFRSFHFSRKKSPQTTERSCLSIQTVNNGLEPNESVLTAESPRHKRSSPASFFCPGTASSSSIKATSPGPHSPKLSPFNSELNVAASGPSRKFSMFENPLISPSHHFRYQQVANTGATPEEGDDHTAPPTVPSPQRHPELQGRSSVNMASQHTSHAFHGTAPPAARSMRARRFTIALEKPSRGHHTGDHSHHSETSHGPSLMSKEEEKRRLDEQRLRRFLRSVCSRRRNAVHEENLGISRELLKERMELLAISNALEACF